MFLKINTFKRLIKKAWKGMGLTVGNDGEGIYLVGGHWSIWLARIEMTNKAKAAIIELTGGLPSEGTAYRAWEGEGVQFEMTELYDPEIYRPEIWDDHRAETDPYDKAHPGEPPRTYWSNWNKPGEQEHWCRGGENYPVTYCPHFVKYKGQQVKTCLKANVSIFQDGYIDCSLVENFGCEACYREFEERTERS